MAKINRSIRYPLSWTIELRNQKLYDFATFIDNCNRWSRDVDKRIECVVGPVFNGPVAFEGA